MPVKKWYKGLRSRLRFYRHHSSHELMWGRVYFSQYGEDVFLLEYFKGKRDGLYVDVGAFHPVKWSNTYAFYRSGWSGIEIEPNPDKIALFRKYRPRDTTLQLAVSESSGPVAFAVDEGFSGIADERYFQQGRLQEMRQITVQTLPLSEILDEHVMPSRKAIDILSVDCEGHDEAVLRSNDWERHRPLVVLCEAFGAEGVACLTRLLEQRQYRHIAACGPTLIFEDERDRGDRPHSYHSKSQDDK